MHSSDNLFGHSFNPTFKVKYPDVLLYSRTVVESREYVSTGVLNYAEGDIIEIELNEFKMFKLKETVKITVYSPVGILTFASTVIAKAEGSVVILSSQEIARRFGEIREFPRVNISAPGFIYDANGNYLQSSDNLLSCSIDNISLGGVGFKLASTEPLADHYQLKIDFHEEFRVQSKVEIVRVEPKEEFHYYGAKFIELPDRTVNSLRAYIMAKQLEIYFAKKRASGKMQGFGS